MHVMKIEKDICDIKGKWELIERGKTRSREEGRAGLNSEHVNKLNIMINMH